MMLTSSFECRIPCKQGDITVVKLSNGEWKLSFKELAKAVGVAEEKLLASIREITTSDPEKFPDPILLVQHLKVCEKGRYSVKPLKLIALECAVAILVGETCMGNLLAGQVITETFYHSLIGTFEILAKLDKEENDDNN